MVVIVYIETNFLLSIATGRDPQAEQLLENQLNSINLVIPSICCMEALSAFEDELKRRNRFTNELNNQISQLRRDVTSPHARSLLFSLEESLINNQALLNDIEDRLFRALEKLDAKSEMISLTGSMLKESLNTPLIEKDPTDNLILHCILQHASLYPNEIKVLLSGNSSEFNIPEVRQSLREVGVNKYFTLTDNLLGWLNSQSRA